MAATADITVKDKIGLKYGIEKVCQIASDQKTMRSENEKVGQQQTHTWNKDTYHESQSIEIVYQWNRKAQGQ